MGGGNQIYGGGLENTYGYQCDVCGTSWSPSFYGRRCPNECVSIPNVKNASPSQVLQPYLDEERRIEHESSTCYGYLTIAQAKLRKYDKWLNREAAKARTRKDIARLTERIAVLELALQNARHHTQSARAKLM
jgi:hypothetical protein